MIYFTSDHHFGHFNIIQYCNRPFTTAEEMDEHLIEMWNKTVTNQDFVYHLGDFTMSKDSNYIKDLLERLNGNKAFVDGNHSSHEFRKAVREHGWLMRSLLDIKIKGYPPITLCHYPMLSWNKSHYGAIQLFGHHHGTISGVGTDPDLIIRKDQQMDVGVDTNNFKPYSIDEVIKLLDKQKEI